MQLTDLLLIVFLSILFSAMQVQVEALICYSCTYISLQGSNIPDDLIPGSDDRCITKEAFTADCDIYTAQYGEVTQCIKYDTISQIQTATGESFTATFVRKQCDFSGLSTQETDYCLSADETNLSEELSNTEFTENLEDIIGAIQNVEVDGYVCRCDSDECNTSMARKPKLLFVIFVTIVLFILM
ncbi:uncharacterized protein [Amphiura filiformis]|uniref:uncharacterized protein n=1 Tax=Amphiura filiformis TaxID=82378 RepID=UPI003B20ECD0